MKENVRLITILKKQHPEDGEHNMIRPRFRSCTCTLPYLVSTSIDVAG